MFVIKKQKIHEHCLLNSLSTSHDPSCHLVPKVNAVCKQCPGHAFLQDWSANSHVQAEFVKLVPMEKVKGQI